MSELLKSPNCGLKTSMHWDSMIPFVSFKFFTSFDSTLSFTYGATPRQAWPALWYVLKPGINVSCWLSLFYQVSVLTVVSISSFHTRHLSSPILSFRLLAFLYKNLNVTFELSAIMWCNWIDWGFYWWDFSKASIGIWHLTPLATFKNLVLSLHC